MVPQIPIADQFAYTTIRIECGAAGYVSCGTGFYYNFAAPNSPDPLPAIITNRHVVENAEFGKLVFHVCPPATQPFPRALGTQTIDCPANFAGHWIGHPDPTVDLCALLFGSVLNDARARGRELLWMPYSAMNTATRADFDALTALEEILMIGYPNGIWDDLHNMPVYRRGVTATHPGLDYRGKAEFLTDIPSFGGSSGSPVLLYNHGAFGDRQDQVLFGSRVKLLGIHYAGYETDTAGRIVIMANPPAVTPMTKIPLNLGVAIKATRIAELQPVVATAAADGSGWPVFRLNA
jgi:hypothetical protein